MKLQLRIQNNLGPIVRHTSSRELFFFLNGALYRYGVCIFIFNNLVAFTELELFEDGPYGNGGRGRPWTDVDTFMENGPLTAIEIRAGSRAIIGLRARYTTILLVVSTVKLGAVDWCTNSILNSLGHRAQYITACNFTVLEYCN